LGLSLVKAVIEAHGGKVEAISASGRGSLFSIYLPSYKDGKLEQMLLKEGR
jgi:signal transduction histidine kinase